MNNIASQVAEAFVGQVLSPATIIDKLDGQQITNIIISLAKYGTICYVAYVCGSEGLKSLMPGSNLCGENVG